MDKKEMNGVDKSEPMELGYKKRRKGRTKGKSTRKKRKKRTLSPVDFINAIKMAEAIEERLKAERAQAPIREPDYPKHCPKCEEVASNKEELELLFGWRSVKTKAGFVRVAQSQCKKCRN